MFSSVVVHGNVNVLIIVKARVSDYMNEALLAPYTAEEVIKALFSIGDIKAPGPDGLHAIFFKKYWHIIGDEITKEVLLAINSRKVPAEWNGTTIVLIPKVENPINVTQFRPISLCNVLYKIASKVISNRLKQILPDVISEEQLDLS